MSGARSYNFITSIGKKRRGKRRIRELIISYLCIRKPKTTES
jgi:hypothetical protein